MVQNEDDLPKVGSPAQRALAAIGVTRLIQVTRLSEAQLLQLHGVGPKAIKILRIALEEKGLTFRQD